MKRNWMKTSGLAIVVGAVTLGSLAGCGGKVTAESLVKDMASNLEKQESYNLNMKMDMEMSAGASGINLDMSINMDQDTAVNLKPEERVHGTGKITMDLLGQNQEINMETYSFKEDGKMITYTKSDDADWEKSETTDELEDAVKALDLGILQGVADNMTLDEETTDAENIECYALKGSIKGEDTKELFETMLGAVSDDEGMDKIDWANAELPFEMYVDKKEKLPVKLTMDGSKYMQEIMGVAMAENGEVSLDMKKGDIEFIYDSFGEAEEIEIPDELKQKSKEPTAA